MTKEHLFEPLYDSQGGSCALCAEPLIDRYMTHVDRIIPGREGGGYTLENCRLICPGCDWEREGNRPGSRYPELRMALSNYTLWQRTRKSIHLRMIATEKTPYVSDITTVELEKMIEGSRTHERYFEKLITKMVKEIELGRIITSVHGTGAITAALLLSRVDLRKADTPSALSKFFGLAGPSSERYEKGKTGGGSKTDRAFLRQWGESQIRLRTPYREDYDRRRSRTDNEDKWKSDAHRYADAIRITVKLFLFHYWEIGRKFEGLKVREPYAMSRLGHDGYISPQDRGWPEI